MCMLAEQPLGTLIAFDGAFFHLFAASANLRMPVLAAVANESDNVFSWKMSFVTEYHL